MYAHWGSLRCRHRWLPALLAMLLSAGSAHAQVADLELLASAEEIIVTPLREQTVRLSVRNRGPDGLFNPAVSLGRRIDPTLLVITPQPGCSVSSDVSAAGVLYVWNVETLSPGQNATCDFTFRATSASPTDVVSFRIGATQAGSTDPDPFNSFITLLVARSSLDRPVNVLLTARRIPGGIQPAGTTQRVELTLTNRGPNAPDRIAVLSNAYLVAGSVAGGFRGYDVFPRVDTPPCVFLRDLEPPAAQIQLLLPSPLLMGTSVTCSVDVVALDQTPASSTLEWSALVRGAGVYDTDQADNQKTLLIPFQAPLPIPFSPIGLVALALFILGTAVCRIRFT